MRLHWNQFISFLQFSTHFIKKSFLFPPPSITERLTKVFSSAGHHTREPHKNRISSTAITSLPHCIISPKSSDHIQPINKSLCHSYPFLSFLPFGIRFYQISYSESIRDYLLARMLFFRWILMGVLSFYTFLAERGRTEQGTCHI